VTLRVRDTGTGMDAETQRRALEPFFTTKPEGAGTGLGLAVVYGVVQSLRGSLQIESLLGAGTVVELSLPPTSDTPDHHDGVDAGDRLAGDERVLIVEDRDVVRDLTRDVLEAAGFAVHVAANGDEGLALASGLHFDLVVTDVVMPGLSGPELAAALRRGTPELPVLFMSGYTDDILDASALALPHTGFLRKPFSGAVLVRRVRDLLDERAPARNARSRARTPPSRC
jgi:CheY-like chemotaxis protein